MMATEVPTVFERPAPAPTPPPAAAPMGFTIFEDTASSADEPPAAPPQLEGVELRDVGEATMMHMPSMPLYPSAAPPGLDDDLEQVTCRGLLKMMITERNDGQTVDPHAPEEVAARSSGVLPILRAAGALVEHGGCEPPGRLRKGDGFAVGGEAWSVEAVLGSGAFATVVQARRTSGGESFAVKVSRPASVWEGDIHSQLRARLPAAELARLIGGGAVSERVARVPSR